MFLTRGRLMLEVPALRARLWGFLQENQTVLCQVFATPSGRDPETSSCGSRRAPSWLCSPNGFRALGALTWRPFWTALRFYWRPD
jgi:hypothetical protein